MHIRALAVIGFVSTLGVSCALFTPIDDIRESAPTRCTGSDCSDAGRHMADASTTRGPGEAQPPAPGMQQSEDAGASDAPAEPCSRAASAECNPLKRCGCDAGLECRLDELALKVRCQSSSQGSKQAGQPCADTQDCTPGLACTRDRVCSPYCESDADCKNGKCVAYTDRATGKQIAGASACSRWCHPISDDSCQSGTSCYVTAQDDPDPHAACRALRDKGLKVRGEPCQNYNECEAGLSCAEFGPRVCTNFCIFDSDCPNETPHCYTDFRVPQVAAPGVRTGQCVVAQCNDSTIPSPEPWNDGPVWTATQRVTCGNKCGPSRDCFRQSCTGGEIWGRCMDTAVSFCGGAKGAACRTEYVALSCSDAHARDMPEQRFRDCLERQTQCFMQAEQVCAATQ